MEQRPEGPTLVVPYHSDGDAKRPYRRGPPLWFPTDAKSSLTKVSACKEHDASSSAELPSATPCLRAGWLACLLACLLVFAVRGAQLCELNI